MPEKKLRTVGKATNGKKQKCATHIRAGGVSVPMRRIRCTHNTRGGTDWNGGTKVGWKDVRRDIAGTVMGIASYELTVTASLICDVSAASSRYTTSLSLSFSSPADAIYFLYPFLSKVIPLFSDATLSPVLPTICLRLIDCARSSSISTSGISITVFLFLL